MGEDEADEVEDGGRNAGGLLGGDDGADAEVALETNDGGEGGDEFGGGGRGEEGVRFVECCGRGSRLSFTGSGDGPTDDFAFAPRVAFKEQAQHNVKQRARRCLSQEGVGEVNDRKTTGGKSTS